jgi:hypothetical protein
MHRVALAVLAVAAVAAAAPARAQAWDPNYPVCLRIYGPASYNECRYRSLAQCAVIASGRSAQCVVNPYFDFVRAEAPARRPHRHRRVY